MLTEVPEMGMVNKYQGENVKIPFCRADGHA